MKETDVAQKASDLGELVLEKLLECVSNKKLGPFLFLAISSLSSLQRLISSRVASGNWGPKGYKLGLLDI